MHDRPTAEELVEAVRQFLEEELLSCLSDQRLRFQTLVAANVLSIAARELKYEDEDARLEYAELAAFLREPVKPVGTRAEFREATRGFNEELCSRIRSGAYDKGDAFTALAAILRRQVQRKLRAANPRFE
jgi:hypothetical protein